MPSLLDPDYQFGTSPLPQGPPTDLLGLGQLQVTPPPQGQPDLGDALGQTYQMITDAMAKARWPSVEEQRGLLAPLPGWQGTAVDAAKQWADAIMMGTTAPGDVPPPGIVAYHGSPHSFDQFDTSKIGTGEGNQAFGHGLYFAEKEGTAQSYRDALATDPRDTLNNYLRGIGNFHGPNDPAITVDAVKTGLSRHDDLAMRQLGANDAAVRDIVAVARGYDPVSGTHSSEAMDAFKRLDAAMPTKSAGSMYQVNIGADPEHFLDWDKPLSEQHPKVQEQLADVLRFQKVPPKSNVGAETTGGLMMQYLEDRLGKPDAANELASSGVPGIRYLDQGSRGAGQGTHNYVVFDPATIEILRKYGIAGLLLGGGAAATQRQSNAQ